MTESIERLRFLTSDEALSVAEKFGTPTYVYDEATLRSQAKEALAMPNAFGLVVRFAMKTIGPNHRLLNMFQEESLGIDASSEYEAFEAIEAGFAPYDIAVTSQQLSGKIVELAQTGVEFNVCSLRQLKKYGQLMPGSPVGVRINPDLGSGHSAKTNVGGPSSSFGIWHEYTDQIEEMANRYKLTISRLHSHIGSGSNPKVWTDVADMTLKHAEKFPDVETVDLGGGFKVARMQDEITTDMAVVGEAVKNSFEQFAERTGRQLKLEIEPGTFLIANAGAIVSTIIDIKDTGKEGHEFIVVDSGMTENLRPALYGAQHPLVVVSKNPGEERRKYVVVGHNCESGDLLTPKPGEPEAIGERLLEQAQIGDLMVIEGTGAYCASMAATHYNSFPAAKEVLRTTDGSFKEITRSS